MRRRNELMRGLIRWGLLALGAWLQLWWPLRAKRFGQQQARLKTRLGVGPKTPIVSYGAHVEAQLAAARANDELPARQALTSGSVNAPKRIGYSEKRLKVARWVFFESLSRVFWALGAKRTVLFVLAPARADASLTSLLLEEQRPPPWWALLQAPYRAQTLPEMRGAIAVYGETAVKAWLLTVSSPGLLYATNPSTVVAFTQALRDEWQRVRQLAADTVHGSGLHSLLQSLESVGARERLEQMSSEAAPLSWEQLCPQLDTLISWDGGYVRPFLERARAELGERCRFVPMYSMSTETIETLPAVVNEPERLAYLPMAPGVLYELLPEGAPDEPAHLIGPEQVKSGERYTLVVSDVYGLRRYQTDDVFRCERMVEGLPDLRFERRRTLSYSFTGEKLTGEQVELALAKLQRPGFWCCFPCAGDEQKSPHYVLVTLQAAEAPSMVECHEVATRFDEALCAINTEFHAKRSSGRLGPVRPEIVDMAQLLQRAGVTLDASGAPPPQFKFLPLYTRLWSD